MLGERIRAKHREYCEWTELLVSGLVGKLSSNVLAHGRNCKLWNERIAF